MNALKLMIKVYQLLIRLNLKLSVLKIDKKRLSDSIMLSFKIGILQENDG